MSLADTAKRYAPKKLLYSFGELPTHFKLNSGDQIPTVALGTWRAEKGGQVGEAVKAALRAGYRHIDGAWYYGNEDEVGKAIKDSEVPREEIWLTSKLWNTHHAPEDVESALDDTLRKLGTDYLDLYLIHWPIAQQGETGYIKELTENHYPTWQKLEEMVEKGKVRNIGVSNFTAWRIQKLLSSPLKIKPAVNQVEMNYWLPQPELLEWCKKHGILVEAYSPIGSAERVADTLALPIVKEIAQKMDQTPSQVHLEWLVQRGVVVLPKSVTPERVEDNLQLKALPKDLFDQLEIAATSHKPERGNNLSETFKLDFDMFE